MHKITLFLVRGYQSNWFGAEAALRSTSDRSAVARSVGLNKFTGYNELIAELDKIFEFNGELVAPNKKWLVFFTDDEGDKMQVGDDPWE